MGFASLGSGSRGNGTLVALGDQVFLVDCGFTLKQSEARLSRLGLSGGDIDGIFVTHEHSDHIGGVAALAYKFSIPVYGSYGSLKDLDGPRVNPFDGDVPFDLNGVKVNPVRVPHDAREPTQFVFSDEHECIGVLSDIGRVTKHVIAQYQACTHILLEANHDLQMLMRGSYPPRLKRRVAEDYGHLNNEQAAQLLQAIAHDNLEVVIGHVSEQNNSPNILQQVFEPVKGQLRNFQIASQAEGFDWRGRRPLVRQVSFSEVL